MSTVTCRTEGCVAEGEPRQMVLTWTDAAGETVRVDSVVCGGCEQPITDIAEEPATEGG